MLRSHSSISFLELFLLNTIVYFDLFEYPPTLLEIYQCLYTNGMEGESYSFVELQEALETSELLQTRVGCTEGFYFLKGRESILETRKDRYVHSFKKYELALHGARLIRLIPFVELFAVCNNLANNNAEEESDIDIFIITKKNRLYLTRFLVTIVLTFFRLRRHGNKVASRLCLSFYTTEDNLDFEELQIPGKDIYLPFWAAQVLPVFEINSAYTRFMQANEWITSFLPHIRFRSPSYRRRVSTTSTSRCIRRCGEILLWGPIGDILESLTRFLQTAKMSANRMSVAQAEDTRVIISKTMLKFHENDRRAYYTQLHDKKIEALLS